MARRTRTVDQIVDDLTDTIDPTTWAGIDSARIRAGGSWSDMRTLRIRQADDVLEDKDFTVLEVTVKRGEVYGVRILQRGVYAYAAQSGPFLLWELEDFVRWFSEDIHIYDDDGRQGFKQVWIKNKWVGAQAGLVEIHDAFLAR